MATTIDRIRPASHARHENLEELLVQQEAVLRDRKQNLRSGLLTEASGVVDFEERSLDAEEQGVGFSVLELTSRTVQGIETALQRLEAGVLGTCSDCGSRISDARLRALPFAALCIACQQKHDTAAGLVASRTAADWKERIAFMSIGSGGH
jgi:DnaK suppressor protein